MTEGEKRVIGWEKIYWIGEGILLVATLSWLFAGFLFFGDLVFAISAFYFISLLIDRRFFERDLLIKRGFRLLHLKLGQHTIWILFGVGTLFWCVHAFYATQALRFPLFDAGIFHQIIWAVSEGEGYLSTISGAGNLFRDHFSPTLALLSPVFWMTGGAPWTLPLLHVLLLAGSGVAWIVFAKRLLASEQDELSPQKQIKLLPWLALSFLFLFGPLWGNLNWGFHENAIALCSFSWASVFIQKRITGDDRLGTKLWILILLLISGLTKEHFLLTYGLVLIGWGIFEVRGKSRFSVLPLVFGLGLLFLFVTFAGMPKGEAKNYFARYYGYWGNGLGEMVMGALSQPWKAVEAVGIKEMSIYLFRMFAPFLGLPLISLVWMRRKKKALIWPLFFWAVAGVSFATGLLATYSPLRDPDLHYSLEIYIPFILLVLAVLSLRKSRKWVLAVLLVSMMNFHHDPRKDLLTAITRTSELRSVREKILAIPKKWSVMASENAGPFIASRKIAARFGDFRNFKGNECPDLVLVHSSDLEDFKILPECGMTFYQLDWKDGSWQAYSGLKSK